MSKHLKKTNAIRLLDQAGIDYDLAEYQIDPDHLDGLTAASKLGVRPEEVYKTLLLVADKDAHYVVVVPVDKEVDFKKVARCFQVKHLELSPLKDLTKLTGYLRGGCSPLAMKKNFPSLIDLASLSQDRIYVNAGRRGLQLRLAARDLAQLIDADFADLVRDS